MEPGPGTRDQKGEDEVSIHFNYRLDQACGALAVCLAGALFAVPAIALLSYGLLSLLG